MIGICLLIKDENEYLSEWLDWHFSAGVDHIYIYDNGSIEPVLNSIPKKYINNCTVIDWSGPHSHTQIDSYTHCLENYGAAYTWMGFIDTDEFIYIENNRSIPDYLNSLPSDTDGVVLRWVVYNANGHIKKTNEPVRKRFTQVATYPPHLLQCKCIIKPKYIKSMAAHGPIQVDSHQPHLVNSKGENVWSIYDSNITPEVAWIDHYFTRSLEEWQEKINRGSCDPLSFRHPDFFFDLNPEMR